MAVDTEIEHGYKVKDKVSGFVGIVTLIGEHISGCTRIGAYPVGEERTDRRGEQEFFFEEQLEVLEKHTEFTDFEVRTDTEFELGEVVEDEISGFEGVVSVINYKLWNCPSVNVAKQYSDEAESEWFDDVTLSSTGEKPFAELTKDIQEETAESTGSFEDKAPANDCR